MTRHVLALVVVTAAAVVAVLAAMSAVAAHHVLNPDGWTEAKVDAYIAWALGDGA